MLNRHRTKIIYILLLLALTLPSRLTHIDAAVNIDEPWWVISSSNFYYAVTHRDFQDTYFEYHPGVTNMWVISTAMLAYFPEYRGFGQGFFDQRKPFYEEFLRENGKETIELVRYARYIQAGVLAVFAVIAFLLLSPLSVRIECAKEVQTLLAKTHQIAAEINLSGQVRSGLVDAARLSGLHLHSIKSDVGKPWFSRADTRWDSTLTHLESIKAARSTLQLFFDRNHLRARYPDEERPPQQAG